jgi:hypothetical protein
METRVGALAGRPALAVSPGPGRSLGLGHDGLRIDRSAGVDVQDPADPQRRGGASPVLPFVVGEQVTVDRMAWMACFEAPLGGLQRDVALNLDRRGLARAAQPGHDEVADSGRPAGFQDGAGRGVGQQGPHGLAGRGSDGLVPAAMRPPGRPAPSTSAWVSLITSLLNRGTSSGQRVRCPVTSSAR